MKSNNKTARTTEYYPLIYFIKVREEVEGLLRKLLIFVVLLISN